MAIQKFHSDCSSFALCFLPPPEISAILDQLRAEDDKAYATWPPHIRISYLKPAVANSRAFGVCLETICSKTTPFDLTICAPSQLTRADKKDGRKFIGSNVQSMSIQTETNELAVFLSSLSALGLSPPNELHCTVAQKQNKEEADNFLGALNWNDEKMTWKAESLELLHKRNGRFLPVRSFFLENK